MRITAKIAFTGHRDRLVNVKDLDDIPRGKWVHGGAVGFDNQVENYARSHGIETKVIRPNYDKYGRKAPLIRNEEIVKGAELLVACYDRRTTGGTFYTIEFAKKMNVKVTILDAILP